MRNDSLIAYNMSVSYGGAVSIMHDSTVQEIGPYPTTLKVGSTQKMYFDETDDGPFWLDEETRSLSKFDVNLEGESNKEKTKIQLLLDLRIAGVDTTSRRFF